MTLRQVLDSLRTERAFMRNVAAWERLPARAGRWAPFPAGLDPRLVAALGSQGITALYTHQAQAVEAVLRGEHVVVVTATASGKTLCYNLPVLNALLADARTAALYLFPTKALAQDQLTVLQELSAALQENSPGLAPAVPVSTYDGDTPRERRRASRGQSGITMTNPDMLHTGILPHHTRWAAFFQNLRFVVLDELHSCRGVFGSHVANLIRRLKRVAAFYGARPQFICCSATIANPLELAQRLTETTMRLIDDDGAPRGEKHFIVVNPPLLDAQLGQRRSATLEARDIAARLIAAGVQTIAFARSRLATELLLTYVREAVAAQNLNPQLVRGYRGGYLPGERRAIEKGLRDGSLRGVVATNALELGVDIGQLDAAVLAGFPGTIASTWQQAGRAGRRNDVSAVLLVASASPLDQYIAAHPRYFFERSPEHGLVAPDNLVILSNHLKCAAFELPFDGDETFGRFAQTHDLLDALAEEGILHKQETPTPNSQLKTHPPTYFWMDEAYPAAAFSLRTGTDDTVVILDVAASDDELAHRHCGPPHTIGQIDRSSAPVMVYEGAIYLHEGQAYLVERLDWEAGQCLVRPAQVDYYTEASTATHVQVAGETMRQELEATSKSHGDIVLTWQAAGYRKVKLYTHETLGWGEIELPEQELDTTAYWFCISPAVADRLLEEGILLAPNDYGPNWEAQRRAARRRDGYRCRQCGAPEKAGRQHDVHHIQPFRQFGYLRGKNERYLQANALENLVSLCPACHHRAEAARGVRTALGSLSYVIGNLAPLFVMCDPRDIGVLAEARSPFTGLPTITVYDRVPAGIGLSVALFDLHDELLRAARELVNACNCESGCPACIGPGNPDDQARSQLKRLLQVLLGE
ncbi:MAG: DEAD/DEAH box helicase [Thermoflexales bacterium]|nr:DEAD/DEAH box helicase [Thermoflexales bacterium]